ncbi:MAG: phosphoenolpyruvate carboxykinase [Chloroflexi bacterium]|nr:phosphoenolpyruvate carboxykinase [Chloroflexota bacterium]MCL5074805.1 phosphoenolpyruvate carboxykinase [Chloroflexota bacterium]
MESVVNAVRELYHQPNVSHPNDWELRQIAETYGTFTRFGNVVFHTTVKNRSAGLTVYVGGPEVQQAKLSARQREILKKVPETLEQVHAYMKKAPFVCIERTMGDNTEFAPHCTLFVSTQRKDSIRLAHMWGSTLFPPKEAVGPNLYLVYIPEWQEKDRQILVFPEEGVTYVLGSDYFGESKKGFLRMAMWRAKQRGMLGVHAGAKILRARDRTGRIRRYGMLIFGLTATGKTTHSCHNHGLTGEGEGVEIVQDDIVLMKPDGSALGTERGFYIKTEGVNPESQPLIYSAVTKRDAILENVMVDYLGNVDFQDELLTGNGRGIIQRDDLGIYRSESINLPPLEEIDRLIIASITRRNTVVPIASKLSLEQGVAAFMLGESIESSGSDPRRAGESVREVGTNPFIIGNEAAEGNRFYEFINRHPEKVQCYLLNTGGVGEIMEEGEGGAKVIRRKVVRVEIPEMAAIIRGIARGDIEWVEEPHFGTLVPKKVEGVDMSRFDPPKFYSQEQIDAYVSKLRRERIEYLESFPSLDPAIVDAIRY